MSHEQEERRTLNQNLKWIQEVKEREEQAKRKMRRFKR